MNIDYGIDKIRVDDHVVSVGGEHRVRVVEHLFSTLYALDLFNVCIDVHGDEMPFFDGSSKEFVNALKELPGDTGPGIRVRKGIRVNTESGWITYTPMETDELLVEMSLKHSYIGEERMALQLNAASYEKEIAAARTFVFTTEDDPRLSNMPAYGIGITEKSMHSATPLRYVDEPVRHKILDLLGDLYVLRKPIYGRIRGENTSHHLNLQFVRKLISTIKECDD
jgi:UDP-3-O-[3-hydroxymyristoyl] N-acetylglucosamine deacetylase